MADTIAVILGLVLAAVIGWSAGRWIPEPQFFGPPPAPEYKVGKITDNESAMEETLRAIAVWCPDAGTRQISVECLALVYRERALKEKEEGHERPRL